MPCVQTPWSHDKLPLSITIDSTAHSTTLSPSSSKSTSTTFVRDKLRESPARNKDHRQQQATHHHHPQKRTACECVKRTIMKCSICYEICSDVETTLNHLKSQHSRGKQLTTITLIQLYCSVEYLQCATNGFVFIDQCRKCGLAGAARKHYGPRGALDCEKQKLELKALGIKPLIPWTIQALTRERISTHTQVERTRKARIKYYTLTPL